MPNTLLEQAPVLGESFSAKLTNVGSEILNKARQLSSHIGTPYAGSVPPKDAWQLIELGEALLIDVRTAEERQFVGYVPRGLHIEWMTGLSLAKNPLFISILEESVSKDQIILFLCRSGKRSAFAAEAATRAGFAHAFNILEGFEGDLDAQHHRGAFNGWRYAELPWIQN